MPVYGWTIIKVDQGSMRGHSWRLQSKLKQVRPFQSCQRLWYVFTSEFVCDLMTSVRSTAMINCRRHKRACGYILCKSPNRGKKKRKEGCPSQAALNYSIYWNTIRALPEWMIDRSFVTKPRRFSAGDGGDPSTLRCWKSFYSSLDGERRHLAN